jgi:hypothetical protein
MKKFKTFLTTCCLLAIPIMVFASTPVHTANISRNSIGWAWGYAETTYPGVNVATKLTIGIASNTKTGYGYSKTNQVSGFGSATSGYWTVN